MKATQYQLVVVRTASDLLDLEEVAARTDVHPEVIRRFVDFGLIEPVDRPSTGMLFVPDALHRVRIIQRLRCDLGINLQGIAVILDLLDRLSAIEHGGDRGYQ